MKVSLKAARVNAKMSQIEVAEKLGITTCTLRRYESGKADLPMKAAIELTNLYGLGLQDVNFFYHESTHIA